MRLPKPAGWPLLAALFLLAACQSEKIDNTMLVEPEGPVSFSQEVLPLLTRSCGGAGCHIDQRTSGVSLSSHAQVTTSTGVQYGERIVQPGDAEGSPIIDKLEPNPRFGVRMPLDKAFLSAQDVALIKAWIDEGALDN